MTFEAHQEFDAAELQAGESTALAGWGKASHPHLSRLAQIAKVTASTVIITDIHGVIVWVNGSFTRVTGYSFEEAVGRSPGALLQGADTDQAEKARIGAAIRARQSVSGELINYTKSGLRYWVGMKIEPVKNEVGEIDGFMAIMADISERHEKKLQLELLTKRLNIATHSAHVGLFERDLREQSIWWNPVMYQIAGKDPDTFTPTVSGWLGCVHEEDLERVRNTAGSADKPRSSPSVRYRIVRPDGSICHVESIASADGESAMRIAGIVLDVTERVESERQLREEMRLRQAAEAELGLAQKLESVGRLAAGIAHEINTPIQYIGDSIHFLGCAFDDLLKAVPTAAGSPGSAGPTDLEFLRNEVPRAVERILEGTQRVATIVRAMKEFAHPDATEKSAANLNKALATTLLIAHNEYKYVATVRVQYGDIPDVLCNVGELSQVFLNLIVNAAHALADAGRDAATGFIDIATAATDAWAELTFADNGCGIAQEIIDKIYDPFFTTKEVGRGSGQGLAIARSIVVDKHAGRISVSSAPGVGTCFTLRLPLEPTALAS